MSERNSFEIRVGGHELVLELGNCCCVLFRRQQEVDYLAVDVEDDDGENHTVRVFNNTSFVRWLGGYALREKDGNFYRVTARKEVEPGVQMTFREYISQDGAEPWSPAIVEREEPNPNEIEMFIDVNAGSIDQEWQESGE